MADSLLNALLGQSAQERLANDPFYVSGVGLSRQQITPTSNLEAVLIPALQGLAGGAMQGYGRSNVASAMASSPLVEALKINTDSLDKSDPFKVESALSQALLRNQLEQQGLNRENDLAKAAIGQVQNPKVQKQIIEALLGKKLGIESPPNVGGREGLPGPDESAFAKPNVDPLVSALTQGGESVLDKQKRIYNEMLDQGMPPTQAAVAARDQIAGENKANQGSFDLVKQARDRALKLQTLSETAQAGIDLAGQTGFFPTISSGYEKLMSAFGSAEAAQQSKGDAMLNAIKPEVIQMARTPGSTTEKEMLAYLQSGPSTENTPDQNRAITSRISELAKLENEYADFLSAYRDANNGSTINADKLWNQYRAAVPLFDDQGNINSQRVPWQTFFQSGGATPSTGIFDQGVTPDSLIEVKTLKDGSQVKVRRLPGGGYEEVS